MNNLVLLCRTLVSGSAKSQRELADELGVSVGSINKLIKKATEEDFINSEYGKYEISKEGLTWLEQFKVDNAIIMAAGTGTRFVPFTFDTPKGLLKVKGVPMLHSQIEQLIEVGIPEIIIVVGYMAEKFEYLIDKYGVTLVYNPEYATKNNYASLYRVREHLGNSYVLAADNWIENNIFNTYEAHSWISCIPQFEEETNEWGVTIGAHDLITKMEFVNKKGWGMVGPAYFDKAFSEKYVPLLEECYARPGTDNYYWEHVIKENIKELPIAINKQEATNVYEFESIEELRLYDPDCFSNAVNGAFDVISKVFGVPTTSIVDIDSMNDGMTNRSFVFKIDGNRYVYRQPGAGTEQLISRSNEKKNYELIASLNIADELMHFDGETGVKITRFYDARVGNPFEEKDVAAMMEMLRRIHEAHITAPHRFDIAERIAFYEELANERNSILFEDYDEVRNWSHELLAFKDTLAIPEQLCHIDYVHTNVLFTPENEIRVIDWEYAGMADPLIDVAMFSIYAYYTKDQMDKALRLYLSREPERQEEARLYLYVALGGFLWSIWTEYKQGLGDEFGDYALEMYRYMKDYYHLLKNEGYLD